MSPEPRVFYSDHFDRLHRSAAGSDLAGIQTLLLISGKCHPSGPVHVTYRDGVLTVVCAICQKHVTAIAVAP